MMKKIPFEQLTNPVLEYPDWSIKDFTCAYLNEWYYLFFSAFYEDNGEVRSHIVEIKTQDFINWTEPILNFDGEEEGWIGMCSPEVVFAQGRWILGINSWGNKSGAPNQLFYKTSYDLESWSEGYKPVAANLTKGVRVIDTVLTYHNNKYYLIYKENQIPRIANCETLDGDFKFIKHGYPSVGGQENYQFLNIDGRWMMLTTDMPTHTARVFSMIGDGSKDEDWLRWEHFTFINPDLQSFNTRDRSNAGDLYDWREMDGYFYLLYAGNGPEMTYSKRGHNKLGLCRSKDLITWQTLGPIK